MLHANRSKLTILLLAIACVGMTSRATERKPTETKRFVPATLARFELVLGQLQLSSEYFRIGAAHERSTLDDGRARTRSISVSTLRGKPTLQFSDQGGDEEVQLSFKADSQVDLSLTTGHDRDRYKLTYHQPDKGQIVVRVEFHDGRSPLEFKSRSIWHLAMKEPQFVDHYLQPCISRLDPSWHITRTIDDVRRLLNNPLLQSDSKDVERMIERLDGELAVERNTALAELESMGIAAEHQLRRSLTGSVSSQKETSIKRLLRTMHPTGNDTPMRVAVWLSGELM